MNDETLEPRKLDFGKLDSSSPSVMTYVPKFTHGPLRQPGDPMPFDLYDADRKRYRPPPLKTRLSSYSNNIRMPPKSHSSPQSSLLYLRNHLRLQHLLSVALRLSLFQWFQTLSKRPEGLEIQNYETQFPESQ